MKKTLVFNWKMNPSSLKQSLILAKASDFKSVIVASPFPFIEEVGKRLKKAKLAAQDLFWEAGGAFTGEVSVKELKSIGVKFVIVGHSERRYKLKETDKVIAKKLKAAVEGGLTPILCVGETWQEKAKRETEIVIKRQIRGGLSLINKSPKLKTKRLLIAYEPVWAIGTGDPETPESALKTIKYIKSLVIGHWSFSPKVLYGGSVNSRNLKNYLQYREVDGALVGGASLKPQEIKKMMQNLSQYAGIK